MELRAVGEAGFKPSVKAGDFIYAGDDGGCPMVRIVIEHEGKFMTVDPKEGDVALTEDTTEELISFYRRFYGNVVIVPNQAVELKLNLDKGVKLK